MITVVSLNPAIDRLVTLQSLVPGQVQRAREVRVAAGGKGVHVAQTIAALGEAVRLVAPVDAAHRDLFQDHLRGRGVEFHGVDVEHPIRVCLAVREQDGRTTEILEPGTRCDDTERDALVRRFQDCLDDSHAAVLSGSLPPGFPDETYARLVHDVDQTACPCFVDASGEPLRRVADANPHLIKPNCDEAMTLTGRPLDSLVDASALVRDLFARGVSRPIVTLGAQGAVGYDGQQVWHAALDIGHVRNAVGSGDCLLAGVVVGWRRSGELSEALRLGVACGGANALGEEIGQVQRDTVETLVPGVRLTTLDI